MTNNITYRSIQPSDYKAVAKIIQNTWFNREETAQSAIPIYGSYVLLHHTLARHDFSKVALKDGKPIGLILGKGTKSSLFNKHHWLFILAYSFKLVFSKDGRASIKEFIHEGKINKKLMHKANENFDGELVLFILGEEARGLGIGSNLFQQFVDYQEKIHSKNYFLYTDDACTFSFYEHKGLERKGSYDADGFNYYIYKGNIQEG